MERRDLQLQLQFILAHLRVLGEWAKAGLFVMERIYYLSTEGRGGEREGHIFRHAHPYSVL